MNSAELHQRVLPSLLAGTSRHPLRGDGALEMLSLMGQALRFERPQSPDSFHLEPEIKDERRVIAEHLRRPLIRILTAKTATEHPARALARAFDRLRLRPHPFDLPLIDAFVRFFAEKLGPTAQRWADRQRPESAAISYFDAEVLDESNWMHSTPARRVAFLEQRRRDDADAARALLEATWGQEDADARFRLLQVLHTGLSMADEPFLSSLEKDRAPRVRTLAAKLLSRLGASRKNPFLDACLERIKKSTSGLLRKRMVLQLELPANVREDAAAPWILQTFGSVSFAELAEAFQVSETELIEAADKSEPLLLALVLIATGERRLDLLELLVARLPNAWERMREAGLDTLGAMTDAERQRWQEMLVHPYRGDLPVSYVLWDWLHRIADQEAPPSVMSAMLQSKLLARASEAPPGSAIWVELFAAMSPASHRQELREQLAALEPAETVTALALLETLDGMEKHV